MDAELLWLEKDPNTTLLRKDCINAFVGAIREDGSNIICEWVRDNNVQQVLFHPHSKIMCSVLSCLQSGSPESK